MSLVSLFLLGIPRIKAQGQSTGRSRSTGPRHLFWHPLLGCSLRSLLSRWHQYWTPNPIPTRACQLLSSGKLASIYERRKVEFKHIRRTKVVSELIDKTACWKHLSFRYRLFLYLRKHFITSICGPERGSPVHLDVKKLFWSITRRRVGKPVFSSFLFLVETLYLSF